MNTKTEVKSLEDIFAEMKSNPMFDHLEEVDLHSHIGIDGKRETLKEEKRVGSWEDWCDVVFSGEPNKGKRN